MYFKHNTLNPNQAVYTHKTVSLPTMNNSLNLFLCISILYFSMNSFSTFGQTTQQYKIVTIAFYNVENLFDYEDDPLTFDDDRTPEGKDHWTPEIYQQKIDNIAKVIAEIGVETSKNAPIIIGLAEIENQKVLEDLIANQALASYNYQIVHYDAPDRRGIDVALLFQKKIFIPTHTSKHELLIYDTDAPDKRVYTRDQLLVSGVLDGDAIHFLVNHWPSRRGGEKRSAYKRMAAAKLNKKIIDSLQTEDPYAKIITMGDLNDDPTSPSLKKILKTKGTKKTVPIKGLYNPMESLHHKGYGSLAYGDRWNLFDQIIMSKAVLNKETNGYHYYKSGIYSPSFLTTPTGRYKGYPFRSFANGHFTGGYSDHFPVYLHLVRAVKDKN